MLGRALGAVLVGIEARPVEVEVDLGGGLPTIAAVGLADGADGERLTRQLIDTLNRLEIRHLKRRIAQLTDPAQAVAIQKRVFELQSKTKGGQP